MLRFSLSDELLFNRSAPFSAAKGGTAPKLKRPAPCFSGWKKWQEDWHQWSAAAHPSCCKLQGVTVVSHINGATNFIFRNKTSPATLEKFTELHSKHKASTWDPLPRPLLRFISMNTHLHDRSVNCINHEFNSNPCCTTLSKHHWMKVKHAWSQCRHLIQQAMLRTASQTCPRI